MFKTVKFLVSAGLLAITMASALAVDTHEMYVTEQNYSSSVYKLGWPSNTLLATIDLSAEKSSNGTSWAVRDVVEYNGNFYVVGGWYHRWITPGQPSTPNLPNDGYWSKVVKYDSSWNKLGEVYVSRTDSTGGLYYNFSWHLRIGKTPGTATFEKIYVIGDDFKMPYGTFQGATAIYNYDLNLTPGAITHAFYGNPCALDVEGDYVYALNSNWSKPMRVKGDFTSVTPYTILSPGGVGESFATCYTKSGGAYHSKGIIVRGTNMYVVEAAVGDAWPMTGIYNATGADTDTGSASEILNCGSWLYTDLANPSGFEGDGDIRMAPDGNIYSGCAWRSSGSVGARIIGGPGTAQQGTFIGWIPALNGIGTYCFEWVSLAPPTTTVTGVVLDSNTSGVNCNAQLVGRSYSWKVLSTGENGVGTVGTGGAISFTVTSTGASDVCIKVDGALSVKAANVTLSGNVNVGTLAVTLPDILNDDVWDDFDLNEVNGGFGSTVTPGSGADYNCDGLYDDFDLNQVNGGFGSTGACFGL